MSDATVIALKPRAAPQPAPEEAVRNLDPREALRLFKRHMELIAGLGAVGMMLALLAALLLTPQYRSEAMVMLNTRQLHVVNIDAVMSGLPADNATLRSEMDIIASRAVMDRVIDNLKLDGDPEFHPSPFWRAVNPAHWFAAQPSPAAEAVRRRAETERALRKRLEVDNDGRSFSIRIAFHSKDAAKAAVIANGFADAYLTDQLEAKYDAANRATAWLSERLDALKQQVAISEKAVEDFRQKANLLEVDGDTMASEQLSAINSQLVAARAETAEAEARVESADDLLKTGGVDAAADVLASPLIQKLREQEAEVRRNEAELATRYGDAHPKMINARAEYRDLQAKITEEVQKIIAGFSNEVDIARAKEAQLAKELRDAQEHAGDQLKDEVTLRQLEREATADRSLYENFLNRFKQTGEQQDLQNADARIIARALAAIEPFFPLKWAFMLAGLMLGLGGGVLAAYLFEALDRGFRSMPQIEALTGVPAIGLVPSIRATGRPPEVYVMEKPLSDFCEALRTVRAAVQVSNIGQPPKSLAVTSALPGEGKTMFSLCLARTLAASGNKILLLDADLRRPSIAKLMGQPQMEGGLIALLAGKIPFAEAVKHDPHIDGLDYIPACGKAPNAQDLLGSKQMEKLLREAAAHYDLVIVDTPPLLAVADAAVASRVVDATVFIVHWAETPREAVQQALKKLASFNGRLAGLVLNRVDLARHARYGDGDDGYYYSRYREYYVN